MTTAGWKLLYQDTFDRETPISCDASGTRLVDGLRALWRKTLREGLTDSGSEGFARFHLSWDAGVGLQNARIETSPPAPLAALRRWVEEDASLLDDLAATHLRLIEGHRPAAERTSSREESDAITAVAARAGDPTELRSLLGSLDP